MEFNTKYNFVEAVSQSGKGQVPVYISRYDKNGKLVVVPKMTKNKDGKLIQVMDDVNARIQAGKDSVDIKTILKKFTVTGDESYLNQKVGAFLDLTQMPENIIQAKNMELAAKETFDGLPIEVKKEFNNDYMQFMASAGTDDFFKKLGYKDTNKDGVVTKEEVKEQTNMKGVEENVQ